MSRNKKNEKNNDPPAKTTHTKISLVSLKVYVKYNWSILKK